MPNADQLRIHVRWRPGWSPGRRSYAWLLPLADQAGLRQLVNQYQYMLLDLPGFDLVPLEWMHILVQEAGFTDHIAEDQVDSLVGAAQRHLASVAPLNLAFQRAVVLPESLALPGEPQSSVQELRSTLRAATAEVLAEPEIPDKPEATDEHVSIAYSTTEGPAIVAVATLASISVEPTTASISAVELVELNRDHSNSEWRTVARIPLSG